MVERIDKSIEHFEQVNPVRYQRQQLRPKNPHEQRGGVAKTGVFFTSRAEVNKAMEM